MCGTARGSLDFSAALCTAARLHRRSSPAVHYRPVVLCVDVEVYRFDRNFPNDGQWRLRDGGPAAYEVLGPVSPNRIRIHIDGQCIALSEYVGRN